MGVSCVIKSLTMPHLVQHFVTLQTVRPKRQFTPDSLPLCLNAPKDSSPQSPNAPWDSLPPCPNASMPECPRRHFAPEDFLPQSLNAPEDTSPQKSYEFTLRIAVPLITPLFDHHNVIIQRDSIVQLFLWIVIYIFKLSDYYPIIGL